MPQSPIHKHRATTANLARKLKWTDVYHWLVQYGYFPESYVLPPCFSVTSRPNKPRLFNKVSGRTKPRKLALAPQQAFHVHFPKTAFTDRRFSIIHPELHNDIAYHIARNWKTIVDALIPPDSDVTCYSFPVPIDTRHPGRVGTLRSGRMIYEFLSMTEDDIASVAYQYAYIVRADIKSFYPSIYTHSIAWALHGKTFVRKGVNRFDAGLLGNRLDKLFQYANDQRTNGIPIGPVVSDIVAEIIAAAVDKRLTAEVRKAGLACEMVRFKDDYRILVKHEHEGAQAIRCLQAALQDFDLELAEAKTAIHPIPEGLFRSWVSHYHLAYPRKLKRFTWKDFRELYLAVLRIDHEHPGTGVIDRFLVDIVSPQGLLKVELDSRVLAKTLSMLMMLAMRRNKAFPKVIAIIEALLRSPFGRSRTADIVAFLQSYLLSLATNEERNQYPLAWIAYFLSSNNLKQHLTYKPHFKDPIVRTAFVNRAIVFRSVTSFKLFIGARVASSRFSMLDHLDIFNPPVLH